ncbi:RNA dependent RNA polymerase-domain-containing protein [Cokeromyces recurvatus]|uniref:RNA dependent RNA polymerase-domain-containing protein n=1 Tax=Cokeromyces recurvatus TaxID=90255 RepID=UPI0022203EEC|nr:RNA dependent RNA polymerase-domain-containing protein [Cokeromyces recurvatus]KAI7901753.1 RNA dependent RNA polymerase-domain-containing protein [Cokeromyces recurvatus]
MHDAQLKNLVEEDDHCYFITNLASSVNRAMLWKIFGQFGTIKLIEVSGTDTISSAIIVYNLQPSDQLCTQPIYIKEMLVSVQEVPISDYIKKISCPVPVNKLSFGGLDSPRVFIEEWFTDEYVTFDLNVAEKYMEIFFAHIDGYYRLRVPYDHTLKNTVVLQRHNNISSLTISSKYPAYFWKSRVPMQKITDTYDLKNWERVLEIPRDDLSREMIRNEKASNINIDKEPISPSGQFPDYLIKLNMWTVYRLEFHIPYRSLKNVGNMGLNLHNLTHESLERKLALAMNKSVSSREESTEQIIVQPPIRSSDIKAHLANMPFEVQYMMEHAFNLKILREYNVDSDFFETMQLLPPQVSCTFLTILSGPQKRVYNPDTVIKEIFKLCKEQIGVQQSIPKNHTMIRRVLITPTSIYPLQPVIEPMNNLQYHFQEYADRFLYVQFTDEHLEPIGPIEDENQAPPNNKIYSRIFSILRRGLRIAGRTYEFLGSSIDNLREHGCWFFSPTHKMNRTKILHWMGDFQEIKTVSTFVNSVGQEFTPRLLTIEIKPNEIEEIDDYYYNDCNFTLDCGKMSPQIARDLANQLDMDYTPSVVRFNLCGSRGILMLSNFLTKRKIQLRSSQIRFESRNLQLEIIKVSKPNPVYLDKRSITLLSSLGVKDYIFQDILEDNLTSWGKDAHKKTSIYLELLVKHYKNNCMDDFQRILNCDFLDQRDPFIFNLVAAFQNSLVRGIKEDCKLYVKNGIRVFAIMDETGSLKPGEIFLQVTYSAGLSSDKILVEGPCVVYRDSSCFPEDVKVVNAIKHPRLRHYTNVLVYCSHDMRDLPSSCSNDDNDEDNFTIIWDHRLIPTNTSTGIRSYKTTVTSNSLENITFKEAAKFFTTYISRDILHSLNDAYIALADRHKEGIFNGGCVYLSQHMSRALDFAKTGVYATLNHGLSRYPYPDFMNRNSLQTYYSNKSLGSLFRTANQLKYSAYITNHCTYDPRLYVEDMYKYVVEARKMKAKYDHSLRILLGQYSVQTEIEFISGHIISWPKYLNPQRRPIYCEHIRAAYGRLKYFWKQQFDSFLIYKNIDGSPKEESEILEQIEARVAAWYYVTYHPSEHKSDVIYNSTLLRYMSFPWVVDDYLCYVASKNSDRPILPEYLQPIPPEKISNYHKLNMGLNIDIMVSSESEDDEDENSESEDADEAAFMIENATENPQLSNNGEQTDDDDDDDNADDEMPILAVKITDLLKLQ